MENKLTELPQAIEHILKDLPPSEDRVSLLLQEALNFTLAETITSSVNVPGDDNSAMDGFAINSQNLKAKDSVSISQRIAAGDLAKPLLKGTAARIFTGAMIPEGADTVLAQESCGYTKDGGVTKDGDVESAVPQNTVVLPDEIRAGSNIRKKGQDIESGKPVLQQGQLLGPAELGLLASIGVAEVRCFRKLKIAIFSTGDELLEPGEQWQQGKIYNSNRYGLKAMLQNMGFDVIDFKVVGDNLRDTELMLAQAAQESDCIISTGGVSVGEEDYVKAAVNKLGEINLWRLALKPGKPLAYGKIKNEQGDTPLFGLPGNPVAVFVVFLLVVKPCLLKLQGRNNQSISQGQVCYKIKSAFAFAGNKKRVEYLRVKVVNDDKGEQMLELYVNQSSGVLSSIAWADGLAEIEAGQKIEMGDELKFYPMSALLSQ